MTVHKRVLILLEIAFVLCVIFVLLALLLPPVKEIAYPAHTANCAMRLRQISLAFAEYESIHGDLPPIYTVDADGKRLHSWRTLLLPFLGQQELYDSIDLSKPWDDPVNAQARATSIDVYACSLSANRKEQTSYVVLIDTGKDGTAHPVAVLCSHKVHWMSPKDISFKELANYNFDAGGTRNHIYVMLVTLRDHNIRWIDHGMSAEELRRTINAARGDAAEQ